MFRIRLRIGNRNLVGTVRTLDWFSIHFFDACHAFGRAHKDNGPAWFVDGLAGASSLLYTTDLMIRPIYGSVKRCIQFIHILALYEDWLVAVPCKQGQQFLVAHGAIDGGIGDFIAIQVYNGQYRAGFGGIKKFVAMPGGCGRAGLRFSIADDTGNDQVRIIHSCAKGGCQGITQLSAFMNGAWDTGIEVTGKPARPGKAAYKFFNPGPIERQVWIEIMECAF